MVEHVSNLRLLATGILLLVIASCTKMEEIENSYPNMQAAISSGAVEKGWVPAFLPSSSAVILEAHNLDTNEVWMRFTASIVDINALDACSRVDNKRVAFPPKKSVTWWPVTLTSQGKSQDSKLIYFACINGGFLAAEEGTQSVFYWHHG